MNYNKNTENHCPELISDIIAQCLTNPERIAVTDPDGSGRSYGEFIQLARKTCGYLSSKGIKPGSVIMISLPNCMEYIAVEFGVWLYGCTGVPVSPSYPEERLDKIKRHSGAALSIDENVMRELRLASSLEVCEPAKDIASVFYTSGSTGVPKGVIHTFETLDHCLRYDEFLSVRQGDVFAIGAPMSFIASMFIFPFLCRGASVRLIGRETMTDVAKLQKFISAAGVNKLFLPPSVLKQLPAQAWGSLETVITGSERVSGIAPAGTCRLFNVYGMTETCGPMCFFEVSKAWPNTPIGKPTSDIEMKIMEDGEICLRGPLSPGYFKDPERSAELWRGGWFHTGDLGRKLEDGNFEYLDRKDWMVKINGQRVEMGEIVQALKDMQGVSDAIAKGFTGKDGHQYVVAYYVAGDSVGEDAVKESLSGRLAPYMMPSFYVRMTALPLNANGKIDIKALRSPLDIASAESRKLAVAENDLQQKLAAAFETALGISPIGIDDDFFAYGGDSIRVMQLQAACPDLELSSTMIYQARTVRRLSEAVAAASAVRRKAPDSVTESCPLTQTQKGIFAESMARRGEAAYNNPFLYRLSDGISAEKLAESFTAALCAHPGLFVSIYMDDKGEPFQKFTGTEGFGIEVETLSDAAFEALRPQLMQPFDILSDRLFRARVFKTESAVWLFYDFHHIVFDGTSNGILLEDLEKRYGAGELSAETYTGLDLALDEQSQRATPLLDECRKWNIEAFGGIDRTSVPDPDRFRDEISFDKMETATGISARAFSKAAEALGVTENILSTAAFGYMLGACLHSKESAFATVYNGRKSLITSRTVSMMVKTLPVICKWDAGTTVGDYLNSVADGIMGAMAHDLHSFAEICAATAWDSRVIFSYQDELLDRTVLCGRGCECIPLIENATGEPLSVELYKKNGSLYLRTEYRSNMYSEECISSYISCFITVLTSLMSAGRGELTSSLNLVTAEAQDALLDTGRGESMDYDRSLTVVGLFRKQVGLRPDAVAVVDEEGSMTYAQLDRASDALASRLVAEGVTEGDFVALMMPRRCLFSVAYLACFKAGAAYVPMDYEYPIGRLQYMLEDSAAKVLVTTRGIYEEKCASEGELPCRKLVFADELPSDLKVQEGIDRSRPDSLAYMIYTSGTTGRPKGVMIEHHSLANLVHFGRRLENIGPGSRIAEHASFSFDGSVFDLMTPLCFGGELHILAASLRKDLAGLYRYFCENRIDGLVLTTQLGMAMLRMYDLKLRYLMVGGEKMSGQVSTSVHLYNAYGPTEFTVMSSTHLVDTDKLTDNIPIGKALPNTLSAIVDPLGRLLPRGMAGELVLIGEQLSRGYWNRPDITAERFAPCPFLPGEKMYHTGDLVKWNGEGELLYLGRMDSQVKLRGFRIELGEIESTLLRFEGVTAGVVAVKEIAGLQHLCAYYCSKEEIDEEELRKFLASSLTDYMVPTAYVRMETLPMTPNGKVDMRSLPIPEIKAEEIVPPSSDMEEKLLKLSSEYLKSDAFGVTTNLISMGMTSLGAISLSVLMEKNAGITIPSSWILEHPTVREWAEYAGSAQPEPLAPASYPAQETYPLIDNQTGVYLDWEKNREGIQYNIPVVYRFDGVAPDTVAAAVEAFLANHPYVRTGFRQENGTVVQLRRDDASVDIPLTELDREPDEAMFRSHLKPFNLFEDLLCRFELFHYGDSTWLLSDFHHIIFDGGSQAVFAREITGFCNGKAAEAESFSAFDYSLYYGEWKKSEEFAKSGQYFKSLLEGVAPATLPTDGDACGSGLGAVDVEMPRDAVRQCCRSNGVTENALFLTAMTQVLHRFSREDKIAILTVSNGRSLRALERSCGFFVQTLPVVSSGGAKKLSEALKTMYGQVTETLQRDKYPYTQIVEDTGVRPGILVAYQGEVLENGLEVGGKAVEMMPLAQDTAKMPLSITVTPDESTIKLHFEYDLSLFGEEDVRRFALAVRDFAGNMAKAQKDADISEIACVDAEASEALVKLGSGPELEVDTGVTVVEMMHRIAVEHPDDIAVVDSLGSLTFAQLDSMSDNLASILVSGGVRREDFVGIMMPRRKEFVVAFMATYKCGAAYVPMDSEYPFERLQYMLEDSKAKALLTTNELFSQKLSEGELKAGKVIFMDKLDLGGDHIAGHMDKSRPEGLAYMIYTSGTTGKPKGVMIEHHSVVNMAAWNSILQKIGRGTAVAGHASFSFDASVLDMMTVLAYGGTLHILDEECRKDPERMDKYFRDNAIEVATMSTQLGMMMLSSYKLSLRQMNMGGEKLTGKYGKSPVVVNSYGPTEFTVCSSYHIVDPDNETDNIPIGKAVPNTLSAIVDPCGQLMPRGAAGELVLVGPQIARGYWNREDVTSKRFVPCPFAPGERMYHTGDLARWDENGELLYMGRIDTQVKLRGFRIEMGEIESVMASFPGIKSCVAQVRSTGGTEHLCAYYTSAEPVDETALKAHLSSRLTSYMVPDAFMRLENMPLTPNGKVDVKKLPDPGLSQKTTVAFEAPEGEVEEAVAASFSSVLGTGSKISRDDSFFLIGGTSLLVMRVIVALADKGYKLTYGDIFKYQTPRALAAFIDGCRTAESAAADKASLKNAESTDAQIPTTGDDGYDYTKINKLLASNDIRNVGNQAGLSSREVGDVLLLGSTGYLGIHVLKTLITEHQGKIWCVIRPKKGVSCEGRLKSYLMYYFDSTWSELFGKRIFVVEGDMTDDAVAQKLLSIKVDTVINCAANVKHFAAGDEIEKINLDGTLKLIDYCLKTGSRLVQTSTHSVSGQMEGGAPRIMSESTLYIGQKLMTKYQTSKFQAERAILEACCTKGLKAKIMRLGNLMPRYSDGEFQINMENNGFMARMRAYCLIGCIASSHLHSSLEFAPIDETARAILTLAGTPDKFTVFHPFNNHTVYVDDVVAIMRRCSLPITVVDDATFSERLGKCLEDEKLNPFITTLLAYSSHNDYVVNPPSQDFTIYVLNAMDWRWPITGERYLGDAFEKLKSLEYFDVDIKTAKK